MSEQSKFTDVCGRMIAHDEVVFLGRLTDEGPLRQFMIAFKGGLSLEISDARREDITHGHNMLSRILSMK